MLKIALFFLVAATINAQMINDDVLCEGRTFEPNCTNAGTIQITSANYGKTDSWFCGGPLRQPWNTNCIVDVTQSVKQACQDKAYCSLRVGGADSCQGFAKYLKVIWSCANPNTQARVNNKNTNILVSATPTRANSVPLHNQPVGGSHLFVFVYPAERIQQVRWYLDSTDRVFTTETAAPWDFLGGRPWDTIGTRVTDGQHKIIAAISFTDGSNGYVDATFTVRNGNAAAVNRATDKTAVAFTEGPVVTVSTENQIVPWTLFGTSVAAIIALSVVIGVMDRKKKAQMERA